ncbi:MAG: exodeoxyribonuclease VII large subunit [Candidatus Pacebacteria bacterium CG2_30_36_39]|nr:exodeoxyribonuclease VII large subunit [Candidatus Pacearchaeota archaeon]OIP74334.1 MAG: exodeoxyribonuclease VII large subunit [Candidatus Pacebacteria bacterium CG2_30_36_39]
MKLTPTIYSVTEFLDTVNLQLSEMVMAVQGEITSLSKRGHVYFSLTDSNPQEKAVLSCALWEFRLKTLPFELEEGMEVQIIGKASIYKPSGRFTFVVDHIVPVGEGALQKAFEALKKKLELQGYFLSDRKRTLPEFPSRIGLLTSETGDAIRDFKKHLSSFGLVVAHYDIKVEGIYAVDSIVEGIRYFNEHPDIVNGGLELIVLTRGGGSLESLQAFNSEAVAQAIFASKLPILSAVGHERDVTIADLTADVRASTPTDAGRMLSENWRLAQEKIAYFSQSFLQVMEKMIKQSQEKMYYQWEQMSHRFEVKLEYLFSQRALLYRSMISHFGRLLLQTQQSIFGLEKQLESNNPQRKLKQGYSFVQNKSGKLIKSVSQVNDGETIRVTVADGKISTSVLAKE